MVREVLCYWNLTGYSLLDNNNDLPLVNLLAGIGCVCVVFEQCPNDEILGISNLRTVAEAMANLNTFRRSMI